MAEPEEGGGVIVPEEGGRVLAPEESVSGGGGNNHRPFLVSSPLLAAGLSSLRFLVVSSHLSSRFFFIFM